MYVSVKYKNITCLFSIKHSKISSHIFDDVSSFFDDAKECCSNFGLRFSIYVIKDKGLIVGFGYDISLMIVLLAQLTQQLSLRDYIYNVSCMV